MPSDSGIPLDLNGLSRNRAQFHGRATFLANAADVLAGLLAAAVLLASWGGYLTPLLEVLQ